MKKRYIKPAVAVENFILSDRVSACGALITYAPNGSCGDLDFESAALAYAGYFADTAIGCTKIVTSQDQFIEINNNEKLCYNTALAVFSS